MNKRILELLEQAGVKYAVMPKDTVYEKFAELLIDECCKALENTERHRRDYFIAKIREHFDGVE